MLARIEESYLTILRVTIICVAGLALLLAMAGTVAATVYFVRGVGSSAAAAAEGGDLAGFIAQKKLATGFEPAATKPSREASSIEEVAASPAIDEAASILTAYLNKQKAHLTKEAEMVEALNTFRADAGPDHGSDYDASLTRLVRQLQSSKGKPLSFDQVGELLQWHHAGFRESVHERGVSAAKDAALAWDWIVRAGQAFLLFTAIAFYFLLVRIERHLKLVKVQHYASVGDEPSDSL